MKKNKKRRISVPNGNPEKDQTGRNILIAVLIIAALFVIPLIIDLILAEKPEEEPSQITETVVPITVPELALETAPIGGTALDVPIHLGSSVYLTEILSATGNYPENGEPEQGENLCAVKIRNDSDKTIEYLTVGVSCGDEQYQFAISTLLPGKTVLAYDKEQKKAPVSVDDLTAQAGYLIFFAEEPSVPADKLYIVAENGNIRVTNIADTDISNEFFVYYKNMVNDEYFGGITYRVRVPGGLKAGDTYNGYAANSTVARTRIMFADDAE